MDSILHLSISMGDMDGCVLYVDVGDRKVSTVLGEKAVFESVLVQIVLTLCVGSVVIRVCPGCDWPLR